MTFTTNSGYTAKASFFLCEKSIINHLAEGINSKQIGHLHEDINDQIIHNIGFNVNAINLNVNCLPFKVTEEQRS